MHERQVDEVAAAHAVAHADNGLFDLIPEMVDHEEEITRVVVP